MRRGDGSGVSVSDITFLGQNFLEKEKLTPLRKFERHGFVSGFCKDAKDSVKGSKEIFLNSSLKIHAKCIFKLTSLTKTPKAVKKDHKIET